MTEKYHSNRKGVRYRGTALKRVDTAVETPDGSSYGGELDDISIAGAAIRFASNDAPPLRVGQNIVITLRLPLPDQQYHTVDIRSTVRYLAPDIGSASMRCGLEFSTVVARGGALYRALRGLANRRSEPRIAPAPTDEITMVLRTGDGNEVTGTVQDISANGTRVLVSGDFETDTAGLDGIALSFQLPSEDRAANLKGAIRNHQVEQDKTYVGIEFDSRRSRDFGAQQREIIHYLMKRQRELIRK